MKWTTLKPYKIGKESNPESMDTQQTTSTMADRAADCFSSGFSCSQAVFSTFAKSYGMDEETSLRVAGAFGAGMAGRAEACGAVTGAFLALGLKYGKKHPEDNAAREKTYQLAADFVRRFEEKRGSIVCRKLTGYDISRPEEYQAAKQAGVFKEVCPQLVREAASILEEIW
jgi:C_GCAxxG_C_C family probable redox protein